MTLRIVRSRQTADKAAEIFSSLRSAANPDQVAALTAALHATLGLGLGGNAQSADVPRTHVRGTDAGSADARGTEAHSTDVRSAEAAAPGRADRQQRAAGRAGDVKAA
jgi:hypothetical protein